jgi:hypothetical protein
MERNVPASPVDAGRARVDRFLIEVSKLPTERLRLFAVAPADADRHRRIVDDVEAAAIGRGVWDSLAEILADTNEWVLRRYADRGYDPTFIGLNWGRSPGTAQDRAVVAGSLREAVTAIFLAPLLPAEWVDELLGGWAKMAEASRHDRETAS